MEKLRQTAFKIGDTLKSIGYQCITAYAIKKNCKPESFSAYLRRLILEDHKRTKKEIINKTKNID